MSGVIKYMALRVLVGVGGFMPDGTLDYVATAATSIIWLTNTRLRRVLVKRIERVSGGTVSQSFIETTARGCLLTAVRYYTDLPRYSRLAGDDFAQYIDEFVGLDLMFDAIDQGKGVIVISAHLGNPEIVGQAIGRFGLNTGVISESLSSESVDNLMNKIRRRTGVCFFPTNFSGLRRAHKHLKSGGLLALLADRDVVGTARLFDFFSAKAPIPEGALQLAESTGAEVLIFWAPRTRPGHYGIHFKKVHFNFGGSDRELERIENMQSLISELEEGIRCWSNQWFPLDPIWIGPVE
ncbi:MAG: lysophospholipid acyltransferase family protein [Dehalococcoidia bacterium]|nr:lysophospholipid acyltransferase family protein [Dehalococcoidia bacterium]